MSLSEALFHDIVIINGLPHGLLYRPW